MGSIMRSSAATMIFAYNYATDIVIGTIMPFKGLLDGFASINSRRRRVPAYEGRPKLNPASELPYQVANSNLFGYLNA